ncbi:MAG: DUF4389 domain-containing protein [Candidatus Hadarchaeales archaeon]
MGERLELILRIPLAIVYGIILAVWGFVAGLVVVIHWLYTLILGKRHLGMAKFTNRYVTYSLLVARYLYLITNDRPWPIGKKGPEEVLPVDIR